MNHDAPIRYAALVIVIIDILQVSQTKTKQYSINLDQSAAGRLLAARIFCNTDKKSSKHRPLLTQFMHHHHLHHLCIILEGETFANHRAFSPFAIAANVWYCRAATPHCLRRDEPQMTHGMTADHIDHPAPVHTGHSQQSWVWAIAETSDPRRI